MRQGSEKGLSEAEQCRGVNETGSEGVNEAEGVKQGSQ